MLVALGILQHFVIKKWLRFIFNNNRWWFPRVCFSWNSVYCNIYDQLKYSSYFTKHGHTLLVIHLHSCGQYCGLLRILDWRLILLQFDGKTWGKRISVSLCKATSHDICVIVSITINYISFENNTLNTHDICTQLYTSIYSYLATSSSWFLNKWFNRFYLENKTPGMVHLGRWQFDHLFSV